jgi:hypothetical protein
MDKSEIQKTSRLRTVLAGISLAALTGAGVGVTIASGDQAPRPSSITVEQPTTSVEPSVIPNEYDANLPASAPYNPTIGLNLVAPANLHKLTVTNSDGSLPSFPLAEQPN